MLQAFFDETATNPNTDTALVFGGFLGQVDQWPLVSEAWNECLGSDPAIPHFSHRNCRNEKKLLDLATVISRFPLIGFCVYIRHKSIAARDASSMRGVAGTRPYDWVFRATTETVLEYIGAFHPSEKVDFTFDNRNELKVCIPYFYERKKDALISCYRHAGQCEPGDDKKSPALQMADLLAGEFNDCKKRARLSEPLRLISKTNGLIQSECAPPAAMFTISEPFRPTSSSVPDSGTTTMFCCGFPRSIVEECCNVKLPFLPPSDPVTRSIAT